MIYLNKIKRSEFFKNTFKMFTSTALSQLIQVLGSLLLAKLYLPEQFGVFSLFISIQMFLVLLSTLRYESAIIIEKNERVVGMLMQSLFIYIFLFSFFVLLILFFLPNTFLEYYKIDEIYLIIPLGVLGYSYYNTLYSYLVRLKDFGYIASNKVFIVVLILLFQLIFYYLNVRVGLVLGFSLGYFLSVLVMIYRLKIKININVQYKYRISLVLKKYFYLIKFGLPTQLIDTLSNAVLPVLITLWFNIEIAGIYFFAYKVTNLPLQLIGVSIGKVFYQKASFLNNYQKTDLYNFVLKIIVLTAAFVIVPLLVLFFYSEDIILFILGEKWVKAGAYISIMVFMLFFRTIYSAISPLADIKKKLHIIFIYSILIFMTYVIAMYFGKIQNDFLIALKIISIVNSVAYALQIIFFINIVKPIKIK